MNQIQTLHVFQSRVAEWANARGLLDGTTPEKQALKFFEEAGELARAVMLEDNAELIDAIGDCLVVLANICEKKGLSLVECANTAYNVIYSRTGKMVNGTFVKD